MTNRIIVVAGPTASGKTKLGIELAKIYGGEIVSADSMQLYRGMDIGTAKATKEEQAQAVHHMLDVADPSETYSVARYVDEAGQVCDDILSRGQVPILVGGTGLYIDSLISGRDFADNQEDNALRSEIEAEYDRLGGEAMLQTLAAFDPERAAKLGAGDKRRIVRAIEIYRLTGKTATEHDEETRRRPPRYNAARIVLNYKDRADLYARIDQRVTQMADDGLYDEVRRLLDAGLSPSGESLPEKKRSTSSDRAAAATPSARSPGLAAGKERCASSGSVSRILKPPSALRQRFYKAAGIMSNTRLSRNYL